MLWYNQLADRFLSHEWQSGCSIVHRMMAWDLCSCGSADVHHDHSHLDIQSKGTKDLTLHSLQHSNLYAYVWYFYDLNTTWEESILLTTMWDVLITVTVMSDLDSRRMGMVRFLCQFRHMARHRTVAADCHTGRSWSSCRHHTSSYSCPTPPTRPSCRSLWL